MIDPITLTMLSALASPPAAMVWVMPAIVDDDAKALEAVEKLIADLEEAVAAARAKLANAETSEERRELMQTAYPDPDETTNKLKEIARAHPKSEAAARAASWTLSDMPPIPRISSGGGGMMISMGGGNPSSNAWASDILVEHHLHSDHIGAVVGTLGGVNTRNAELLDTIIAKTKSESVRAFATYQRGMQYMSMSRSAAALEEPGAEDNPQNAYMLRGMDDAMKELLSADGAADRYKSQGVKLLQHCVANYADHKLPGRGDRLIGATAKSTLFEMQNLQIGSIAPDIEGVDADGVSFKLSDYRGQVVVLDFWGFW